MTQYFDPLTLFIVSLAGAGIGAYIGSYLREKGKNLATREDLDRIVRKTEDIKAEISGDLWVRQRRWDAKWESYGEIVVHLGELHTSISEAIGIQNRGPRPGQDRPDFDTELTEKFERAAKAFRRARRFGSKARLAVAPEVRTALTQFGDKWLQSTTAVEQGTVARNSWMQISDMARQDLFGEPRDRPDTPTKAG
jgi:hypothetical protein